MKFDNIIPLYYWPTVVYLVDDDKKFLESSNNILSRSSETRISTNPNVCINDINKQDILETPKSFFKKSEDEENESIQIIEEDFSKIINLKDDPEKYKIISTVVMDYNLPQGTGVSHIKKIKNKLVQKILLTGFAKPDDVIDAFNNNDIDKYIEKDDKNAIDLLINYIDLLKSKFFESISKNLINQDQDLLSLLSNDNFKNVFNEIISKNKIKEFYILNNDGSYLLINDKNQKLLFICSSTKTLDELELFFDSDHQSVQALKADILNHKKIPFFRDFKFSKSLKPNDWEKYCYDCYKIPNTDLLYALVSNTSDYKY